MANGKALLGNVLGRFIFKEAKVARRKQISSHFVSLTVEGEALRAADWQAGDKVQVFLPGLGMRTYTPLFWEPERGATEFLVFAHGAGPGSIWAQSVREGDGLKLFGPRRSLLLPQYGKTVIFGDETSFAVAKTFVERQAVASVRCVFEVSERRAVEAALAQCGLSGVSLVERTRDDSHLEDAHERIFSLLGDDADAGLVMTGRAQAIQTLRKRMKAAGVSPRVHVKAYWSVGKRGLD